MANVAIIDYGMGNLHSVAKAVERVAPGMTVNVTCEPEAVKNAERVIFPGVGAIRDCMDALHKTGLADAVRETAVSGKPLLAICVGMQALMDFSEENDGVKCLGVIPGQVKFFGNHLTDRASGVWLKVPHMGWNQVHQTKSHPLWEGIEQDARFYFVHSYYVAAAQKELIAGETIYGPIINAALARDNIFAVQFHPEKSQNAGLQLIKNFLNWRL